MDQRFYDMFESNPVIAAVKDLDGLEKCCHLEDIKVVFILFGDICTIPDIVSRILSADSIPGRLRSTSLKITRKLTVLSQQNRL